MENHHTPADDSAIAASHEASPNPAPHEAPDDHPLYDGPEADDDDHLPSLEDAGPFGPVPMRYRHDGWTPDRQHSFIEALADSGCVEEACRAVGMSRGAAYALRRRPDAQAFRLAWDAATDIAVTRLHDSALSRAINGVAVPIFHKGEQVGERRQFNERLTQFLLRYRDPVRYGRWRDQGKMLQNPEGLPAILAFRTGRMLRAAWTAFEAALRGEAVPPAEREFVERIGPGDPRWD